MAKQSIDPALLALQTAKKAMPASPSTQVVAKPSLNVPKQQLQAISTNITPPVAKIGGISSPFWATNINSSPVLWWATPQEIGTRAKELQSLPKAMPATWSEPVKKLSIDDFANKIKEKYPEYKDKDNKTLAEAMIKKYPEYKDKIAIDNGNFITDLWSWIWQSVAWFGNLWKTLAFWAVDLYRQSQWQEKLTPEQRASAEQTPMWQALNTITNRQTPEEKASVWWQIGMVAWSVAQWAALWTPLTNALWKIPWVAQIATKAPVLSKIAGWVAQGLEWQLQYSAAAEWKLPTGKELFTAWAFWWAVNAIWPIAKWIKDMKKPTAPFKWTRNKIAEWLVWSNLKNPAMREKYISKVWQTPEKTLLDEWITGSLWTQATKVAEKGKQAYDTTREALKSIPAQFKSDEWLWITNKILEWVDTSIPWIEDVIAPIKDMNRRFANGSASAMDMNDAKLLLARYEWLYDDFWRVKKTGDEFEKKALAKMYNNMKTEIESVWEQYWMDIKSMNKETQKREWLRWLMDRAVAREAGRDMISLSDYMLWWITIADPMTAIPLTLWKKFFSSPKVTSKIAKFLYSKWDDVITNSASNANMNVANWATKQGIKYPIKLQQEGMQVWGATLPKPTPKTPPITVEKWAIGMWTPKVNKTPVIPPKATVAPSVSAPKVDTFARMTELDSNPLYRKLWGGEILWWGKIKQGLFETPLWTITNEIMDGKVKKYIVNWKTYNASDLWGIREKQAPEVVAQATKVSKAISDLKAIESWKGNIMWSSLRSVLDDLWIKDVNSIPEWTEQDILQMVRARKPVAPKKWMPKLWKEIMEQNLYHGTNKQFDKFNYSSKDSTYWPWVYFTDSKDLASKYATKRTIEQGGKKSIMSRDVSKDSLFQWNDNLNYKKISDADYDKAVRWLADWSDATAFNKAKAEYAKQLMDEGYDWLQIPSREAKWANEYVVFDNRNIKKPLPPLPKKWK